MGEVKEIGTHLIETLLFTSVTITGLWPRIRDPNLPPALANIDTDVLTIKAEIIDDRVGKEGDVKVLWKDPYPTSYPQRDDVREQIAAWEKYLQGPWP
jgi:hypothetical protein